MANQPAVQLGLGLIGIGRAWGHLPAPLPTETEALEFLDYAFELGITFFDTAASYGLSEERVGKFLRHLTPAERERITVSTKFGDHWDAATGSAFVDHSYEALRRSLDHSLECLERVELLQLHKTNPQALQSEAVQRAFVYAREQGIDQFGASVSDLESARIVCEDSFFSSIQFPYHLTNRTFEAVIEPATRQGKEILINRPFNMGAWLYSETTLSEEEKRVQAYAFILQQNFRGFILTGTRSPVHLLENWQAFQSARQIKGE